MRLTYAWLAVLLLAALPAKAVEIVDLESPLLRERVAAATLPPLAERLPRRPLTVDLAGRGRTAGRHGGTLRTFAARTSDLRHVTVYSYARLIGYDEHFNLVPDILEKVENDDNRVFTFTLREGHRWSDGQPFTTEDFRYYWEDIASNKALSPAGVPDIFLADGKLPVFEVLGPLTVRFSWAAPNPRFLPHLAQPRPVFIYAPAHYLKPFHARYGDPVKLEEAAKAQKLRSWAALHNRLEEPYENTNPAMPVLSPWRVVTAPPANRFIFERNPFYHRVDAAGRQLPYIDRLAVDIVAGSLFAAKANAGEADLLMRGISTSDVPVLKEGERMHPYRTLLWKAARGSTYAFYPNLNVSDPVWRALNRDVRYRRALSLGLDRKLINNALLFGLGTEGNNTVDAASPLYRDELRTRHARYDVEQANRLLDDIGLTQRDSLGVRLLSDGRPLEIILEVDGEQADMIDALQLVEELWRDIGVKLFVKPQDRTVLRNRSFAGQTVMVAMTGLDNAIATPVMPPGELAPMRQTHYSWPKWGQFAETHGSKGEPIDDPEAQRLMALFETWMVAPNVEEKARIWSEMLDIHADQQFVIGTVSGDLQPIVVSRRLKNIPDKGLFSWEPTAFIGVYRPDEFFLAE